MKRDFGVFHVALKVLLRKGNEVLFLRTSDVGGLDLPGGRIDNIEMQTPLEKIIAREVREEIGPTVKYKLKKPVFQFRRYVPARKIYNFLTVYEATFLSGRIRLSSEHTSYRWINPSVSRLPVKDFYNKEEYSAFMRYFKTHA